MDNDGKIDMITCIGYLLLILGILFASPLLIVIGVLVLGLASVLFILTGISDIDDGSSEDSDFSD